MKNKYSGKKCVIQAATVPARAAEMKSLFMEAGQTHTPVAQGQALEVKPARVDVRNGTMAGKKDKNALLQFNKGEVVEVGKVYFKKDYIEFHISDIGKPTPGYRSTRLRLYLDKAIMTGGNLEEISQAIDQWFKPVGNP